MRAGTTLAAGGSLAAVYAAVALPLKVVQTAALAEVAHAAAGLVRSPPGVTALQVASRLWVLWGLVNAAPAAATARAVPLLPFSLPPPLPTPALSLATLLAAWCAAEVIRYAFFAAKELGLQPYPLLWARYSAFLLLYPLGISSELAMARLAIPALRASGTWSLALPNAANLGFAYWAACLAGVAVYAPGAPLLYGYMRTQRRKVLGGGAGGKGGAAGGARRAKKAA